MSVILYAKHRNEIKERTYEMNYSFNSRVRYSETGEDGRLTLPGVLNYFQDCCTFHAESIGLGGDVLKARDRAWVLSSWQVIVDEYPTMGTEIKITTAPYEFKGFMGMRNFTIETADGKMVAWANSNWTHLAISTGIPARLTPADTDNYVLSEKMKMDYAPRKIKLPDGMILQESFVVQKHHLDTNHHVNNCQYVCMAEDFLLEDFKVYQMRAEYKMQAKLGDTICPKTKAENGKVVVSLDDENGKPYAILEFAEKQENL